jgi:hypothetical protein
MISPRMSAIARAAPRAVCVTSSTVLRRTLRRTLSAAGAQVELRDSNGVLDVRDAVDSSGEAAMVIVDQATRRALSAADIDAMAPGAPMIVLGESIGDDDIIELLRRRGVDHVIGDSDPEDAEMVITSVKLLSGDIFGLEKYLAWGAKVNERKVRDYEEKREALGSVTVDAKELGARRPLIARIESVVDELLMNALYDAPAARGGPRGPKPANIAPDAEALLRWAADGRYFAVSVQDEFGELQKEAILDHVSRARQERGRPRSTEEVGDGAGAGLGLYFILSSVTRFVANVLPGKRTEVVCLFDLKSSGREAEACARSLHVFRGV